MEEQNLTKKEQYSLRKEQKEKEHQKLIRQKKIKNIIMILIPVIVIIGGVAFALIKSSNETNQETPKIEINPLEYDAGTISMSAGLVKKTYEFKNTGDGDLKIDDIRTSCDCTTARLKVGDKESPEFGMHNNPILWSQKINPGETGYLEITFDPAFHGPQGIGQALRAVYLSTNDPQNKKVEVRLLTNVVP